MLKTTTMITTILCFLALCSLLIVINFKGDPSTPDSPISSSKNREIVSKTKTFGIIYPMAHSYYGMITQIAEDTANEHGVRLIVKAPDETSSEQQIRMMDTLIRQKVDGIAIDPIDSVALIPMINKAVDSGIPVICFESDSPGSKRLAYIGTDNYHSGKQMGVIISSLLNNKGMLLVETGMSEMNSLSERLDGLLTYLNEHTEIQVLDVRYNEGNSATATADLEFMIDNHPHFDAFVGLDFISASSSVFVWKAKGLDRYAFTFGMTPSINEAIHNGQITSSLSQNEQDWGTLIVERLLQASEGKSIPIFIDTGVVEINK
ncbi:sugar ABC transporter substrate-binding protein [Paenibacillus sp. FA6]|uniref:sugar ABC transporter substrate-binding protein n=1 Tax=Paenibacillus sp. FA6 TaxID=3413029 RepID=UPI003F654CC3